MSSSGRLVTGWTGREVLVGELETPVPNRHVHGDYVLEIEQIGVLRGGDDLSCRVVQFAGRPVAVREDDEDAAGAQQMRRGQGDEVAGAVTEAVRVHAGDDEIGALRSIVRANAYLAAKTLDDVPGVVEFRVWIHVG